MNRIIKIQPYQVRFMQRFDDVESHEDCVRVYRSSPSAVTLQIRARAPLETGRGTKNKERNLFGSACLTASQVADLVEALCVESDGMSADEAEANRQLIAGRLLGA